MTIRATPIARFRDGRRQVAITTAGGAVSEGGSRRHYGRGAVVIADDTVHTIAGPIDRATAQTFAACILDGDQRVTTQPQMLLLMAAALVAFADPDAEAKADTVAQQFGKEKGAAND